MIRGICNRGTVSNAACTGVSIYSGDTCIKANIYTSGACLGAGTCTNNICIGCANTNIAGIANSCAKRACIDGACTSSIFTKSVSTKSIYGSAHKSSKRFVKSSKLLVESIFKIPISSCLHMFMILDRVLFCRSTY